jgi:hypothetical protein
MLMVALEEGEGGYEETTCGEGEQDDGAAVGSLGCGWGGGGVVEALGAALGVGWDGSCDECEEKEGSSEKDTFACGWCRLRSGFLHCAALRSK